MAGWAVLAINAVLVGFPVVSGGVAQYAITANVDRHCWYRDGDCRRCRGCGVQIGALHKLVLSPKVAVTSTAVTYETATASS